MKVGTIPIVPLDAARQRKRERPRGRQVDPAVHDELMLWLGGGPWQRELLIEYLHVINDRLRHLPAPHLTALAALMKLPQAKVFEVASFYHHFEVVTEGPQGLPPAAPRLRVRVCDGLPCAMAGAGALLTRLAELLGPDVQLLAAPCVGRCETAPVAVVHHYAVTRATADTVLQAVAAGRIEAQATAHLGLQGYCAQGGYALLRECMAGARDPLEVIGLLDDAGLRGLGGAGFGAGRKWRIVREQPAPRLMAVNLDEGEPGTFKDRVLLETDPHRFIEGVWLAAWAAGVSQITLYLRDEYHACRQMLQAELALLRAEPPAPGLAEIVLRRGAGAYICGEESAMIESIEGRRGLPRLRPPYVAQRGLFGRPTLVHNLETLYWVRELVERGAAWFASQGRNGRQGLRRFSVSGRVLRPGVKLAAAGITLRELVSEHCGGMLPGHQLYAYLPGGASGGILPERLADVPLDFDTLQPHGCFIGSAAVIVLSQHDSAAAAARNVMRFFADESCGQCTPCRAGTAKAVTLMDAAAWDAPLLGELGQVKRDASICGLGQAAPNVVDCVLKYFAHEVQA